MVNDIKEFLKDVEIDDKRGIWISYRMSIGTLWAVRWTKYKAFQIRKGYNA